MNLIQNDNGGWERPGLPRYAKVISIIVIATIAYLAFSGRPQGNSIQHRNEVIGPNLERTPIKAKETAYNIIKASVTQYSPRESCSHDCITASGKRATPNHTVACPSFLPLGMVVDIQGKKYVCEDRTAKWVQRKFGPTFDIFTENYQQAKKFGRQTLTVGIYAN